MSGSRSSRDDYSGSGGAERDPCDKIFRGTINSPKQTILTGCKVGDVLDVAVDATGARPILVVERSGHVAGSLTFIGYITVIDCVANQGRSYKATLTKIANGLHEVCVELK